MHNVLNPESLIQLEVKVSRSNNDHNRVFFYSFSLGKPQSLSTKYEYNSMNYCKFDQNLQKGLSFSSYKYQTILIHTRLRLVWNPRVRVPTLRASSSISSFVN